METIYFNETPCHTYGSIPAVGSKAPDFTLVTKDMKEVKLADYRGKKLVLNVFPSLDTAVCAASVRRFNKEAADLKDTEVLCVSMDLPFAMSRFCTVEGIDKVEAASAFRSPMFSQNYGLQIVDGPLNGLLARAVIIIDPAGNVIYSDLVREITHEPDYKGAIDVLKGKF
ncbi:MAG: thiol peroxidase [Muribaculaceae bacterium]|nr:thiol peroxidase [Muribaculaceae bacterium]